MTSINAPKVPKSEAEYLQRQAEQAKAAMAATMDLVIVGLGRGADPRVWARSYPIPSLLVAAGAGFAAVAVAVPSPGRRERRRLARLERLASVGRPTRNGHSAAADESAESSERESISSAAWLMPIVKELMSLARPLLSGLVAAYVRRRGADGDGKPSDKSN